MFSADCCSDPWPSHSLMPSVPYWALALTYWFHLLAAVTWAGSLAAISLFVLPGARSLTPLDQLTLIASIQKMLEPVTWFCVSLLIATGLFQMSVNPHYNGFLATSNAWSIAMLTKYLLVAIMIVLSAIHTWDVLPSIRRMLMRKDNASQEQAARLQRRATWLLRANLILAALILCAAAFARAA
jgi:uncharacterized membrane protein